MKKFSIIGILFVVMSVFALATSGCSSVNSFVIEHEVAAQAAVMYGVQKFVHEADDTSQRASRVVNVVDKTLAGIDDKSMVIDELEMVLRSNIDWLSMDPPDVILIDTLINAVVAEISKRIEDQTLPADSVTTVKTVLGWARQAAVMYG